MLATFPSFAFGRDVPWLRQTVGIAVFFSIALIASVVVSIFSEKGGSLLGRIAITTLVVAIGFLFTLYAVNLHWFSGLP